MWRLDKTFPGSRQFPPHWRPTFRAVSRGRDSLASMDRIERIVRNTHARLIVQHDPNDFRFLPKIPRYLDWEAR
jgi:hypothetical protein